MSVFSMLLALLLPVTGLQAPQTLNPNRIAEVRAIGNVRTPTATINYNIRTKVGDLLSEDVIQRDVRTLYSLGHFDDIKVETEESPKGVIVVFRFKEKRLVRSIAYTGLKSITQSEILEKYRDRKVGLSQQSPYDPTRIQKATAVIKGMLAEKGHQDAKVEVTKEDIPPNNVALTFNIEEGPKLRIEAIKIEGNGVFSEGTIKKSMKLIKERSAITVFNSKDTYHEGKLADDLTRIRMLYDDAGYIKVNVLDPVVEVQPKTVHRTLPFIKAPFPWGIPIPFWKKQVDRYYIGIKIEENTQYKIGQVNIKGAKAIPPQFIQLYLGLIPGSVYNGGQLRKGIENLKKEYGSLGYINFTPVPTYDFDEEKKLVNLNIDIDEDRRFFVNRIAFAGNTTTRDKVIRRELLLNEGDAFNSRAWDLSILRLNQLGYFEEIRAEDDAEVKPHPTDPEVDVILKVKERGRNSIGFNGGVSGIGGSFLGMSYETNNFLGFGETLQVNVQGGTRQSDFIFSFTEPYLLDRPISTGFSVYARNFKYDQARELFGLDPSQLPTGLGFEDRLNFQQKRKGFSVYSSYPLRLFQRLGLTFQFENSETDAINPATQAYFSAVSTQERESFVTGTGGSFSTFRSRKLIPTFTFSTVDSPMTPTSGQALTTSFELTGGFLGGNVNYYRPTVEYRFFKPNTRRRNVIALRAMASHVQGFANTSVPFYERFYMGGDFDIRGFDFRAISPISFLTRQLDAIDPETGNLTKRPFDDIVYVGGDTQAVLNLEYRIPIVGPITAAPFLDVGNSWITSKAQLRREFLDIDGSIRTEGAVFLPGTNSGIRASTGVELQVIMPVINAPFRLIFAYNPKRLERLYFGPTTGLPFAISEPRHDIKFTVGRTF